MHFTWELTYLLQICEFDETKNKRDLLPVEGLIRETAVC